MLSMIQAEFLKNARGDAFIRFFDPAYVRADVILLDRKNKSLYAVLFEQEHYLGDVDDAMLEAFSKCDQIHLTGMLAHSRAVNLRAPLRMME